MKRTTRTADEQKQLSNLDNSAVNQTGFQCQQNQHRGNQNSSTSLILTGNQSIMESQADRMSEVVSNLFSKNKISSKNAFQVPVLNINHLKYFDAPDEGSWSKISSTLENSSKVYGFRVDWMGESISKITNTMARTQNDDMLKQKESIKIEQGNTLLDSQLKNQAMKSLLEWNKFDISLHLEYGKSKLDSLEVRNQNFHSRDIVRRLLDQNGISKLILATVAISKNLQISILSQNQNSKPVPQSQDGTLILSFLKDKQTLNISRDIESTLRKTFHQDLIYNHGPQPEIGLNNFINELEHTQAELKDFETHFQFQQTIQDKQKYPREQPSTNFDEIRQNRLKIQNTLSKHQQKKQRKRKKSNTLKSKNQRKKKFHEQQHLDFTFYENRILTRQFIFKMEKSNILIDSLNLMSNCRKNSYQEIFYAYEVQYKDYLAQKLVDPIITSIIRDQEQFYNLISNQTSANMICSEDEIREQENLQAINNQRLQEQSIGKCPQIRENKQELAKIIAEVETEIYFSKLYSIHKAKTELTTEPVDFLSVLHLGNEMGLTFKSVSDYDFLIRK